MGRRWWWREKETGERGRRLVIQKKKGKKREKRPRDPSAKSSRNRDEENKLPFRPPSLQVEIGLPCPLGGKAPPLLPLFCQSLSFSFPTPATNLSSFNPHPPLIPPPASHWFRARFVHQRDPLALPPSLPPSLIVMTWRLPNQPKESYRGRLPGGVNWPFCGTSMPFYLHMFDCIRATGSRVAKPAEIAEPKTDLNISCWKILIFSILKHTTVRPLLGT